MSAWARPGVKCQCVTRLPVFRPPTGPEPVIGQVYTIREVVEAKDEGVCLALIELGRWDAWNIRNFRPLVTRSQEQDLEQFIPLLNSQELERT